MNVTNTIRSRLIVVAAVLGGLAGCGGSSPGADGGGIDPQVMADALHAIMEADRTVNSEQVVNRLQDEEQVISASEHWLDERALPLPAQMFRMGAEPAAEMTDTFTYALLSSWPVNASNGPRTAMETEGLERVALSSESFPDPIIEELFDIRVFGKVEQIEILRQESRQLEVSVSQPCFVPGQSHQTLPCAGSDACAEKLRPEPIPFHRLSLPGSDLTTLAQLEEDTLHPDETGGNSSPVRIMSVRAIAECEIAQNL